MSFMLRTLSPTANLADEARLDVLAQSFGPADLDAAIDACDARERRQRKLPARLTLLLPIAFSLYPTQAQDQVLATLLHGLRFLAPADAFVPATKSAICQARYRLGARPLVALFHRVCRPRATPTSVPDAFYQRFRLVALDGTREDVPDTAANDRAFGRPLTQRGEGVGAFPQVFGVYLIECGTHLPLDAGFWPCRSGERLGAARLLRSVDASMLVLWDSGLHSFNMVQRTRARGAHVLGRLPGQVRPVPLRSLRDGSQLAWLYPARDGRRQGSQRLLVRVISYRLRDPARGSPALVHRLLTTLLNPVRHPALDLVCLYHERWEVELVIDEQDTHLRLLQQPLRSQRPLGVIQELYGVLLAHAAVRTVMLDAALHTGLPPRRLSFTHAVQLVTAAIPDFQLIPAAQQPQRYARLLTDIGRHWLPPRQDRINPRVVRRFLARFPPKRRAHRDWPQPAGSFRDAVVLLN